MITLRKAVLPVLLAVILALGYGCDDDGRFDSIKPSVPLIGDIASYQSVKAFKESLGTAYAWEVPPGEHSNFSGDKYRPPFKTDPLLVRDFMHLGHKGDLMVVFFNNRLAKTLFFPSDRDGYLAALSSRIGRDIIPNKDGEIQAKEFLIKPHVRVYAATDYRGRKYVAWEDARLADEMDRWIAKYS